MDSFNIINNDVHKDKRSLVRALELDDLLVEVAEALRYVRAMERINCKDARLEHMLSREMAIDCIRRLHYDMHNRMNPDYYSHRYYWECRDEVIRRGQSLRYTEVRDLLRMARESSNHQLSHHRLELDDGDHAGGRGPKKETVA